MKLATITPPRLLDALTETSSAYHMALGQELVRDAFYFNYYARAVEEGHFVLVDNGAAEPEEERVPFGEIVAVAKFMNATEIVMPDVLRDANATIRGTTEARWLELIPPAMRCVVPQGKSWQEWLYCLRALMDKMEFRTIGVAKHLEQLPGGRAVGLQLLHNYAFDQFYDVHMFGIWEKPFTEIRAALNTACRIRGIDSGAPIAYAQSEKQYITDDYHCSLDWNKKAKLSDVVWNINVLRDAANGGQNARCP